MGFSRNPEQIKRIGESQTRLSQWPTLNQSVILRVELGLNADSLLQLTADRPDPEAVWNGNRFGSVPSGFDKFRTLDLTNADIPEIMDTKRPALLCFPFSLFKPGTELEIDDINAYDVSVLRGIQFGAADLSAAFCRFSSFLRCQFEGSYLVDLIADGTRFVNTSFIGVKAQRAQLDGVVPPDTGGPHFIRQVRNYNGILIDASDFSDASLRFHVLTDCDIRGTQFSRAKFLLRDNESANLVRTSIVGCDFYNAQAHLHQSGISSDTSLIRSCDFTRAMLKATLKQAEDTSFDRATFEYLDLLPEASLSECTFVNTTFPEGVSFEGVDVRGCDFSGSNLDEVAVQKTKEEFKIAVANFDADTIWSDGTPITS